MSTGLVPHQTGTQTGEDRSHSAAYASGGLHGLRVTVQPEGRYAYPEKPYRYGLSDPRLRPAGF